MTRCNALLDSAGRFPPLWRRRLDSTVFPIILVEGLTAVTMPLSWKIGAAAAGVIIAAFAWSGISRYLVARQADEITSDSARTAELNAQQAKAHALQYQAQLATDLRQQREERANTYQQVNEQARQYQAEQRVLQDKQRQEALRVQASYRLDRTQQCVGGFVINRSGSSFTQAIGKDGTAIACKDDMATKPLR